MTIHNEKVCAVAGTVSAGAICAETLSNKTSDLSFEQFLDFLEASSSHGAAVCMSAADFNTLKTDLELACRKLGSQCLYAKQVKNDLLEY